MINLKDYAKIKDHYCIAYFGNSDEYLVQLKFLRPHLEKNFPGMKIYIGCKDDRLNLLEGEKRIVPISQMKARKVEFAHIRELRFNGNDHPIEMLMKEAGLENYIITKNLDPEPTVLCSVISSGSYPTVNLLKNQLTIIKRMAREQGYEVVIGKNSDLAGWVIGVESVELFNAAARGCKTSLIPTGIGERLYKNMFPNGEILSL